MILVTPWVDPLKDVMFSLENVWTFHVCIVHFLINVLVYCDGASPSFDDVIFAILMNFFVSFILHDMTFCGALILIYSFIVDKMAISSRW